jgi:hypothetical protein
MFYSCEDTIFVGKNQRFSYIRHVLKPAHILCLLALLLPFGPAVRAQGQRFGLYQSPKGFGITATFDTPAGEEMNTITLRTDFYGLLSARTQHVGAFLTYTHDYRVFQLEGEDYALVVHAGAGVSLGYAHDYEKGFYSSYDRELDRNPGGVAALAGQIGLRIDFRRHLTLDFGFCLEPGIHLRTNPDTGAVILSFYKNGIYRGYYPHLDLLYRF